MRESESRMMLFSSGWHFNTTARNFRCGHCGQGVSPILGLHKSQHVVQAGTLTFSRDFRICPECEMVTTFKKNGQFPGPLQGENFKAPRANAEVTKTVALYNEARIAVSHNSPSCAILMFRKLLMHIAVEQGAEQNRSFLDYVEYLKTNGVVGKPQHTILDRIRKEGNVENHAIVRASEEAANDLLTLVTLLIKSVYFAG